MFKIFWGQWAGSANKVLAPQNWHPEFHPENHDEEKADASNCSLTSTTCCVGYILAPKSSSGTHSPQLMVPNNPWHSLKMLYSPTVTKTTEVIEVGQACNRGWNPSTGKSEPGVLFEFPAISGYTVNSKLHWNTRKHPVSKSQEKDARCADTWL